MPAAASRRTRYARRRRRRMAAVEHDLSAEQWLALVDAWAGGCAYCGATGVPLQRDCVLPISRGGRYTLANMAPACGPCNASKCNDEVTGWLRRKRLDERSFLERHVRIQAGLAVRFAEVEIAAGEVAAGDLAAGDLADGDLTADGDERDRSIAASGPVARDGRSDAAGM